MSENRKVYSPDLKPYSFEGSSGVVNTILSVFVGPIRFISRVMHNIFVLPANLQMDYAQTLQIVSLVLLAFGLVLVIFDGKWSLLVSQIPVLVYATRLKAKAKRSTALAQSKREVEIDLDEVGDLCNSIYPELKNLLEDD